VEITSPFDGVIKKLYYDPDDMAITGKPLVDIDIQSEITAEDEAKLATGSDEGGAAEEGTAAEAEKYTQQQEVEAEDVSEADTAEPEVTGKGGLAETQQHRPRQSRGAMGTLATPAVRHLTKELRVNIADVQGTGKDGRVLKEDVHRHTSQASQQPAPTATTATTPPAREDRRVSLTPVQTQMFKTMTRSLSIPHFLYTCAADMTALTALRKRLNASAVSAERRLTHLAFILKAVSLAFAHHPLLNSSLDSRDHKKLEIVYRAAHNFGVAIDAPAGLVVPVVRNVQDLSVMEIAAQLRQLSQKARDNKLAPSDFSGATFTISNIGSVGGGVVSPVISEPQVAILGVGRSKIVPAFDENEELVKKEELVLSWSADHRIVDGAECARCAERVKRLLEDPGAMMVEMR